MMNLKFLTSLNVAYDDDELLDVIEHLAAEIGAGTLAPEAYLCCVHRAFRPIVCERIRERDYRLAW
jgi:hypothetical protein